jgi:TPR repeat protein
LVGAECDYGSAYFYGAGVPADTAQQIAWYRKAAERGFAAAQYSLGYAVTVEDPAQAVWWFQKAAEQGYAPAERDLGEAYEIGRGGLRKDEARALELYRRAAARGDVRAQQHLAGKYLFGGAGVPKDPVRGWAWEVLAEFSGEPPTPEHFRSSRLTPEQQAEAEKLASDWYEQHREAMRNEQ